MTFQILDSKIVELKEEKAEKARYLERFKVCSYCQSESGGIDSINSEPHKLSCNGRNLKCNWRRFWKSYVHMLSYFSPHNKTSEVSYFFRRKRKVIEPFTQHLLRFHHYQGAQGQNDFMCESLRLKRQVLDNIVVTVFLQSGFSYYITKAWTVTIKSQGE